MAEHSNDLMRQLGKANIGNESQAVLARQQRTHEPTRSLQQDRRATSSADDRDSDELDRAVDGCER